MRVLRLVSIALLAGALAAAANAGQRIVTFQPGATKIAWTLEATGHTVSGAFALASGRIEWDSDTGAASGLLEIDATSARTGNDRRDRKMHEEVLESAKHPTIRFRPSRVEGSLADSGGSTLTLHGTLSILGADHELALPASVERKGNDLGVSTTFRVPYVAWGLNDPSALLLRVAKEVVVTVTATANLE